MNRLALTGLLALGCAAAVNAAPAEAEALFVRRIAPLLHEKCLACHGAEPAKLKGGLDARTRAGLLRGGASGKPAIVPGAPDASPLYLAVTRRHEPA